MQLLGSKIIDLIQTELVNDKNLITNTVLITLAGFIASGIIRFQKDPESGITYAIQICESILNHVVKENE